MFMRENIAAINKNNIPSSGEHPATSNNSNIEASNQSYYELKEKLFHSRTYEGQKEIIETLIKNTESKTDYSFVKYLDIYRLDYRLESKVLEHFPKLSAEQIAALDKLNGLNNSDEITRYLANPEEFPKGILNYIRPSSLTISFQRLDYRQQQLALENIANHPGILRDQSCVDLILMSTCGRSSHLNQKNIEIFNSASIATQRYIAHQNLDFNGIDMLDKHTFIAIKSDEIKKCFLENMVYSSKGLELISELLAESKDLKLRQFVAENIIIPRFTFQIQELLSLTKNDPRSQAEILKKIENFPTNSFTELGNEQLQIQAISKISFDKLSDYERYELYTHAHSDRVREILVTKMPDFYNASSMYLSSSSGSISNLESILNPRAEPANIKKLFKQIDLDQNGFLTEQELTSAVNSKSLKGYLVPELNCLLGCINQIQSLSDDEFLTDNDGLTIKDLLIFRNHVSQALEIPLNNHEPSVMVLKEEVEVKPSTNNVESS
jgi:hypothetical protein